MRIGKFKIVIIIGFLAIVGVIIMQLFLLNEAYNFERKVTEEKIHSALLDVLEKIYIDNNHNLALYNQVVQESENYFVVNVENSYDYDLLQFYLKRQFAKVKLDLDFEYAVYDCASNEMKYGQYISLNKQAKAPCPTCFQVNDDLIYYFSVRFPLLKESYFKSLSKYWIFTIILCLVLILYVYSVLIMLKQKRYTELQNDFINNMSHEFKTPLSSILIATNFIQKQPEINQNQKLLRYVAIINEQSVKLNQHIEQILSLGRSTSNQIQLTKTEIPLSALIIEVAENVKIKYNKELEIQDVLPTKINLNGDVFHVTNIIYNIIDNAVKYSKGICIIKVEANQLKNKTILSFADNGSGIPEKDLPFVFDKFYRVKRKDKDEIEGFGIGLAYVQKICELHNWKINLKNNNGLTVNIEIPNTDITNE